MVREDHQQDTGGVSSLSCYNDGFRPSDCRIRRRGVEGSVENQMNKWRRKNEQALTDVGGLLVEGRSLESAVFVASVGAA